MYIGFKIEVQLAMTTKTSPEAKIAANDLIFGGIIDDNCVFLLIIARVALPTLYITFLTIYHWKDVNEDSNNNIERKQSHNFSNTIFKVMSVYVGIALQVARKIAAYNMA